MSISLVYEIPYDLKFYYFNTGMLDAGLGETKVNTLMSAINIPAAPSTSMKPWERQVGTAIEQLAQKTCIQAIVTEPSTLLHK